ncbi:Serine carboxypeptidase S28 family protein [Klebsormidium nitens]|uniref:Serine carboxypeptidase S28 family protein n=1 Tax=Klebsormidium nitens TaxID=105231 RepID=A0A1Y1HPN4_KLENI|nr:Serine carboxypeptidase S28 family protein [Klebsormidium nitens]|eukprot:GAQ77788.1 Serine carboxypeptidase S28 family protein [Klebsormidium nitens]
MELLPTAPCVLAFLLILALCTQGDATQGIGHLRIPRVRRDASLGSQLTGSQSNAPYSYRTEYYSQTLDHFAFTPEATSTFQQRYLINDEHWLKEGHGPIFVYMGNEGYIDWFANNTGFLWDIAPEFGALLVFPEHRYYGESMPFGSQEAAYRNASTLGYLSSEQALADYATLIVDLKRNLSAGNSSVVVFGGSYGGMLAAWFRIKYPHIACGAVASSAPILEFDDVVPLDSFYHIVSEDFKRESVSCFETIKASWDVIDQVAASPANGLLKLGEVFRLCRTPESAEEVKDWLSEAYANLAMVDYPSPAAFLAPLPAWPIREVCRQMDGAPAGSSLLERIYAGANVYFNYSGDATCFEIGADPHGENGWNYQACTEMVMPMSSNASNSMFEASEWDLPAFVKSCQDQFGVTPRPNWVLTEYGGRDVQTVLRYSASNIVFSNGDLDPWSGGGVLEDISSTIHAVKIKDGAHHLDFRAALPDDPPSLIAARKTEKAYIAKWVSQRRESSRSGVFFGPRLAIFLAGSAAILFGAIGMLLGALGAREYVKREQSSRAGYRSLQGV